MAQGALPIENIRDYVDLEAGTAWLSFEYVDCNIRIDCKVQEDWVDTSIFARFVDLLAEADPSKIYLYYDLKGQDCIISCVTQQQFAKLRRAGVGFQPLR